MKTINRIPFVFVLLVAVVGISSAQHQWELLGPIDFNAVQKLSDGKIITCTNTGSLYSSTNDGDSWSRNLINPKRSYFCMKFFDDSHGMIGAAGRPDLGYVEVSSDGGKTWTESIVGYTYIKALAYPSLDTAFVLGDHACFRTINRGKTWDSLPIPTNIYFRKIIFTDARNGFLACDSGRLYHTTSAGMTWEQVALPSSLIYEIGAIDANAQGRVVLGNGYQIAVSADNGKHWKLTDFTDIGTLRFPMKLLKILGNDTIIVFQTAGDFRLYSDNFGETWQPFALNTGEGSKATVSFNQAKYFTDVYVDKIGNGFAVGTFGTLYKIRNFGKNTAEVSSEVQHHCGVGIGTFPFIWGGVFLEAFQENSNIIRGFAAPWSAPMSLSTDGGTTWFSRLKLPYTFSALHFSSENNGALFGSRLTKTTNNGISWTEIGLLPTGYYSEFTPFYVQPDGSIFFPMGGLIYHTSGDLSSFPIFSQYYETIPRDTLRKILQSRINSLPYISSTADTMIIKVGTTDSMFHYTTGFDFTRGYSDNIVGTTDGGKHWDKRFVFPDSLYFIGVHFLDAQRGVALFHDTITIDRFDQKTKIPNQSWQTTDGGSHWNKMEGITARIRFSEVKFNRNGSIGVILGTYGDMWVTIDSGKTWKQDSLVHFVDLLILNAQSHRIFFPDDTTVFITSDIGFWRKTFPTAKSSVVNSGSVSNPYLYISAYPSPTNGKVIHCTVYGLYSVQPASVSFTMLDVLGREVMDITTTVRNNSNGAFSTFDIPTASLSAGVYYLILGTSNGGTTQNIVIVK